MSRHLPEKPNLEYLKKQAKELLRTIPNGRLAEAQHTLANEYGFATWAKLKPYVETLGLSPAERLKAAVCDSDALRVHALLEPHPELRIEIDDPLPNSSFGQHALFAAVQRSDRATIDVLLRAGANIRKRTAWWAGGFGVLDDCGPSLVDFLIERGAVHDAHSAHIVARDFGHEDVFRLLMERTPGDLKLALACESGAGIEIKGLCWYGALMGPIRIRERLAPGHRKFCWRRSSTPGGRGEAAAECGRPGPQ